LGWRSHQSYIHPYASPWLTYACFRDATRIYFVVKERDFSRPQKENGGGFAIQRVRRHALDEVIKNTAQWPLETLSVLIDQQSRTFTLEAGKWGTAPIFITADRNTLRGDWQVARLYPYLNGTINEYEAAHFLAGNESYAHNTLFSDLYWLTERSQAEWGANQSLVLHYPDAVARPLPRRLKPGADVLGTFGEIVGQSLQRWHKSGHALHIELSGGLDSATVATAAASLTRRPVHTYGLIMPGDMGQAQKRRREQMIVKFGFNDTAMQADALTPLNPHSPQLTRDLIAPWHEIYYDAIDAMIEQAAAASCRALFTGAGGDELLLPHYEECSEEERLNARTIILPDYFTPRLCEIFKSKDFKKTQAPRGYLTSSALHAAATAAEIYLAHGVWPINPLCTPELVWFCRTLPRQWRENRRLQRQWLLRKGHTRSVAFPDVSESFLPLLEKAWMLKSRAFIQSLFKVSRLVAMGWIDAQKLRSTYENQNAWRSNMDGLYALAVLELTFQAQQHSNRSG
jgi:asparagine synthase (glutamine-hydrolysing)